MQLRFIVTVKKLFYENFKRAVDCSLINPYPTTTLGFHSYFGITSIFPLLLTHFYAWFPSIHTEIILAWYA